MSNTDPRKEHRTRAIVPVQLSSLHLPSMVESTYTQDISPRGARVVTQRIWEPGTLIRFQARRSAMNATARVVYWRSFSSSKFAIGVEFLAQEVQWPFAAGEPGSPRDGNPGTQAA